MRMGGGEGRWVQQSKGEGRKKPMGEVLSNPSDLGRGGAGRGVENKKETEK